MTNTNEMEEEGGTPHPGTGQSVGTSAAKALVHTLGSPGYQAYPLSDIIKSLGEGIRSHSGIALLSALMGTQEEETRRLREQLDSEKRSAIASAEALAKCREATATLNERIRGLNENKVLREVLITVGGLLAGSGLGSGPGSTPISGRTLFVGLAILITGWVMGHKGAKS